VKLSATEVNRRPWRAIMRTDVEFLRARDVAPLLGVGVRRVLQLATAGRLPTVREGRSVLFPRTALDRWLASRAEEALMAIKRHGPKEE
jgi:excisionase family DNA binding protein